MPNHGNLLDNENCSFTEDNLDNVCLSEAVDACGDGSST